jgi:hypothetical protein
LFDIHLAGYFVKERSGNEEKKTLDIIEEKTKKGG